MKYEKHLWTKQQIRTVIDLWETKTLSEIASELRLNTAQVMYMSKKIRKHGHDLPAKRHSGQLDSMVKEVIAEL